MSGTRYPDREMIADIDRIRGRILDLVSPETNFTAVAHAALTLWAQIVKADGAITNEQAKIVAQAVIDHYIPQRAN